MHLPVYLDYNATTPVAPEVLEAMMPYFSERFGNASSSTHVRGWEAAAAVDRARAQVGQLLGAEPVEILFTSGATESVNLAIKGIAEAYRTKGRHIVCGTTEHRAVLDTCKALERQNVTVSFIPADHEGQPDLDALTGLLTDQTILVCMMWANNETGVISPISQAARLVRERGILFLTDATQAVGKIPVSVNDVDLLAMSGHKVYGPKGVGALYVRRRGPRVRLSPLLDGGGQERGLRGGTLNTPGIVGLGEALERASKILESEQERLSALRDQFEQEMSRQVGGIQVNGDQRQRLPGVTNLSIDGVRAADLISTARTLAFSSSSACSSASGKPSHVLSAMGLTPEEARNSVRIAFGRPTTDDEVAFAIAELRKAIMDIRSRREA
jgi:cysteine desulfurase